MQRLNERPSSRRFVRPTLERLENRHLLASISGRVINDVNGNGVFDAGEPGQAAVRVYVDQNENDMFDGVGGDVDPDVVANRQPLNAVDPNVSFELADQNNMPINAVIVAKDDEFASTGERVFGYQEVNFFHNFRRLRINFMSPVNFVSIDFIGTRRFATDVGVLEMYDAQDNLLGRTESGEVGGSEVETMSVSRGQDDIAYVAAFTKREGLLGRLDALRYDSSNSELSTLSGADGRYTLADIDAGTYRINEVVPEGFRQTFPENDGSETVTVTQDQVVSGINFGNTEAVNQPPVARDDSVTLSEDTTAVIDVLDNDSDDDGTIDPSTVAVLTGPIGGRVVVDVTTGDVNYIPNADFAGNDTFTYTVKDDSGLTSNAATVNITVDPINDAPRAANDQVSTAPNTPVRIDVTANDLDVDSALDPASVNVVSDPQNGSTEVDPSTGEVIYTPSADFTGMDSFSYAVSDVEGLASTAAVVTIQVTAGSWQNEINNLDVDNDGSVIPIDVLLVINELNEPMFRDPITGELPPPPVPVPAFFDVSGDNFATPLDAVLIINFLNADNGAMAAAGGQAAPASMRIPSVAGAILATAPTEQFQSAGLDSRPVALGSSSARTNLELLQRDTVFSQHANDLLRTMNDRAVAVDDDLLSTLTRLA